MDWADSFERDGYAIVPDVVRPGVVDALIEGVERIAPSETALARGGGVYAMRNLLEHLPLARTMADLGTVRALLDATIGAGAFVVRGLLFDKTSEANWTVPWHQDLTIAVRERKPAEGYRNWTVKGGVRHVQPPVAVLEQMVTVRIQLDDCGEQSGPLRVLPGSHRCGRLDAEAARRWLEHTAPVPCPVSRGGVVLMRPLLLHASSPATAPGHRRVVHLEFAADPLPGGVEWYEGSELV